MRHWTQDGAHIAANIVITAGIVGSFFGWTIAAIALCAEGCLALVALRALETRDENSAGKAALAKCEALEARLDAVEAVAEEGKKVALGASLQASARNVGRAPTF